MAESIDASLVRIYIGSSRDVAGAGFFVGGHHILTCAHVIALALGLPEDVVDQPSSTIELDFLLLPSPTRLTAKVACWCPMQADGRGGDMAGLELLDDPPAGAGPVRFAWTDQVWGHDCRAFGFPAGFDDGAWATAGLLGRRGNNWIQLEKLKEKGFDVMPGFSGGPVWDEQLQRVVGMIVTSCRPANIGAAFAIPYDVLLAAWPDLASRNPYKGLEAFAEHDSRDFFGRDDLVEQLIEKMKTTLACEQQGGQRQPARLLAVLGISGSGKSSVVMAGLLPCLRRDRIPNSKEWVYLDPIVPGPHPLEALAGPLAKRFPAKTTASLRDELKSGSTRGLHLLASDLVKASQQRVLLVVDQFEEVFTLTTDKEERQKFFELLVTAVIEPRGPLFVILTLRADFYERLMRDYPELYRLIDAARVSVLPMERDDLRKVIEQPAKLLDVQLTFSPGLVDELLSAMLGQSGALPLLEFTLDQLVQRRNGRQLTLQAYNEMGGVKGALSKHAEETYQKLPSDEHHQMARDVFLRLIEPGTTEQETTRRRARRSEFEQAYSMQTQSMYERLKAFSKALLLRISKRGTTHPRATSSKFEQTNTMQAQQMEETLEAFIKARLLTTKQINDETTIEVTHEALIREWRRLAEWLREARDDVLFQQSLSEDVVQWEQRKRPGARLYRGVQLKEAQAWASRNRPSQQEGAFLQASERQRKLNLVGLIAVVLLLFSLAAAAGWFVITRPPSPTLVTTLQDNVNGSLRYCINNAPSGSTITFAQGLHGRIELTGSLVFVSGRQLTLRGPGADQITISGGDTDSSIRVSQGAKVDISGLSFKDSETVIDAFLFNEGALTVTNSIISGNKTIAGPVSFGGGIGNTGTLTVTKSIVSNNSSNGDGAGQGGGIYNEGTLMVTSSSFSNNSAGSSNDGNGYGGGIYNEGTLMVTSSTFSNNKASGSSSFGGGIYNSSTGSVMVTSSTFSNNSANGKQDGQGGGIDNEGKLTVVTSILWHNMASSSSSFGGGIYNYSTGSVMVTSSTFSDNSASGKQNGQGGGIDNDGKLTVLTSTLSNNVASGDSSLGGGIFSFRPKGSSSVATIRFCTIYSNTSGSGGGGVWVDPTASGHMTVSSSIVAANSAKGGPDVAGTLNSDGYNLIGNFDGAQGLNANTDKQVKLADLKIDTTLRNDGGPTQTLALLQGSLAIDAVPAQVCSIAVTDVVSGKSVTISTDQRGMPRPDASENACDAGAYESSY
ncbi:MAG: hypothetical protein JO202_19160 [Ktedonobacteraceae bacterium]|nr:hypothetical protein [Ktedonobacteraceae bacterium]